VSQNDDTLQLIDVLDLWRGSAAFRRWFGDEVLGARLFEACFWELPALTFSTLTRPFECVIIDAPQLAVRQADPAPFATHFGDDPVVSITNLGGDARLIIPTPQAPDDAYTHLLAFIRAAPDEQKHAFWRTIARELRTRINTTPVWLNTSGLGVSWLHVRLDDRPKYYRHTSYRDPHPTL